MAPPALDVAGRRSGLWALGGTRLRVYHWRMPRAAVASGHPDTTGAAVEVLQAGGNAVDAALAAAFASAVTEPVLTSLAGGGFLTDCPHDGDPETWDFFVDVPGRGRSGGIDGIDLGTITVHFGGSNQDFGIGAGSVATPGCLFGYVEAHAARGRVPLEVVLEPAIRLAREGVVLNDAQAFLMAILEPILTATPESGALYAPRGRPFREGETFRNPDLADFLAEVPRGIVEDLKRGALGRRALEALGTGALLTAEDLAGYRPHRRVPTRVRYHGADLFLNPPPSWGGELLALSLAILEACHTEGGAWGSTGHLRQLAEVLREVDRQREAQEASPEEGARRVLRVSGGTTHVSVVDAEGNLASLTTSNGQGCGHLLPGTGIMWNNMLGEDDLLPGGLGSVVAGDRVGSMMCPGIARSDDGQTLAFGSGGSKRIRTALLQVLASVLGHGRSLEEAIDAPRIHWDGELLQVEPGWDGTVLATLASAMPVNVWDQRNVYFGGVHAVTNRGHAAGDPRRSGHAWVAP